MKTLQQIYRGWIPGLILALAAGLAVTACKSSQEDQKGETYGLPDVGEPLKKAPSVQLKEENVRESRILTLILGAEDQIHWCTGTPGSASLQTTGYGKPIRDVLLSHLNKREDLCDDNARQANKDCWDPIVVIKPATTSSYQNLVDIMDELAITMMRKYAIQDFTSEDSLALVRAGKR